jgi:argininosuccinate lyase
MAFRDAHEVVGKAVRHSIEAKKELQELTLDEWRGFSEKIEEDIFAAITLEASVNARHAIGGTAPERVREEIERAKAGK